MNKVKQYAAGVLLMATLIFAFYETVLAASGQVPIPLRDGEPVTKTSKAYANSQVDTIRFGREAGLAAVAFAIHVKDSASFTSIQLRRVIDGVATGFATTDSLLTGAVIAPRGDTTFVRTITIAPLADEYWVIVSYTSSGNGVTSPTAVYQIERQYNK